MSSIPKARELLRQIARHLDANTMSRGVAAAAILRTVRSHLYREPAARKTPPKNRPMTAAVRDEIKRIAATRPGLSEHEIAIMVGVNQGRVSETINGKYD